jgi:ribosomal protein S18 acetylase RimI-like enzyme
MNMLNFRLAKPEDNVEAAKLMVPVMGDLALKFVNSNNLMDAIPLFEIFFQQKNNQYSYENTIVCEEGERIIGFITGYDGAKFKSLREPFIDYIKANYGFDGNIEDETSEGEFYLDTIGVLPDRQGQGIGTDLIRNFIHHAKALGHDKIGLLVDKENPLARKLYERIGFVQAGEKILLGRAYWHLIFEM